ncbi:tryptophan synthase subunit alpha [Marinactinospora thermotolerans]|uniref:Tryptophan synthase alpha chain n=1 Tax=Marinactinospora thermotolerans DSM 45154 TaxID=1122192 RepID=A0A1T4KRW3_9ACTN|nr:tryptophan synthase subunit alpha [Marinactinospora thermotolerans]SJZ45113.1 tryptophan synthase, alpha chain [Marinactinospora thermotolerans DSM 45154]
MSATTLQRRLGEAREAGRAALIGYLPAGFPDVESSIKVIEAMVEGGCDVIEVGLPYSDPTMDGPTIQKAADRALAAGTTPKDVLRVVEATARTGAAALVMSYWNPIDRYGVTRFAADMAAAGGSGVITPDLLPEEAGPWIEATDAAGLDRVFLVAPSSTDERLALTTDACRGFVYAASLMGVTGTRAQVAGTAKELVTRTRAVTQRSGLPICVGLGISNGAQAAEVAGYADGVIVGAGFCQRVLDAPDLETALTAVRSFAQELAEGVRGRA